MDFDLIMLELCVATEVHNFEDRLGCVCVCVCVCVCPYTRAHYSLRYSVDLDLRIRADGSCLLYQKDGIRGYWKCNDGTAVRCATAHEFALKPDVDVFILFLYTHTYPCLTYFF